MDPNNRTSVSVKDAGLAVPDNLDATMQLLFLACQGDVDGLEELLMNETVDVNSIDLDGRTALHIAACEGHLEVVSLLISMKANIDARDRWGSTVRIGMQDDLFLHLFCVYLMMIYGCRLQQMPNIMGIMMFTIV